MAAATHGARKGKYRVKNWREYNESLVARGDVTLWFSEDVIAAWEHDNAERKVGRPFIYSDLAIETMLALRELFRLPYRQTEGLGRALAQLMQADLAIPDFTCLAKRAAKLNVSLSVVAASGPIDLVVDSTGLKVYGEGEWKVRQHGVSGRRTWRKLHLAVNPATHEIVAEVLTESGQHDAGQVEPLLAQIDGDVGTCYADGAYDQWKVYGALEDRGAWSVIPPRRNAMIKRHGNAAGDPLQRDECIRQIRRDGRKAWKKSIGYHRRSLAETAMYRMKRLFGPGLKNRLLATQQTEARLRCKVLNKITQRGMPLFEWD